MSSFIGNGISFISFTYLGFLLAAVIVRYVCPKKAVAPALLLISWAFYCTWNPACLVFLLITTISTYAAGLYLGKEITSGRSTSRKAVFILTLCLNIGLLFFCKYWGMFFPGILEDRLLPVGISFYTLQALGYLIDTYRYGKGKTALSAGHITSADSPDSAGSAVSAGSPAPHHHLRVLDGIAPERNFINYALFVAFFPGIQSGPIERAGNMLPQYRNPGRFDYENMRNGLMIMVWGYFLKLVLADRIKIAVDTVYADPGSFGGTIVVLAVLLYSLEIYCDFAGYSAIAIGSARILGLRVMQNFEAPYLAGSVAEFWRRWHISLSTWFRDYLYIPLGGNRKGTGRKYLNILVVFAVSGMWHGVGWHFLIWGILHGIYQVIGYVLKPARDAVVKALHINRSSRVHIILKAVVTYLLVSFAWIFFRASSTGEALNIIRSMRGIELWKLGDGTLTTLGLDTMNWILLAAALVVLFLRDLLVYRGVSLRVRVQHQVLPVRWFLYLAMVMLILICGIWGPGYDASSFIYSQF